MPTPPPPTNNPPPTKHLRHGPHQRNTSGRRAKNGSYRHYYTRRNHGIHGDDRLPLLRDLCNRQQAPFTLLDIGCNDGTLTNELASLDKCTRATGVDINPNLIGDARNKLREIVDHRRRGVPIQGPLPDNCDTLPMSVRHAVKKRRERRMRIGGHGDSRLNADDADPETTFPANVTFRTEDFANPEPTRTSRELAQYDIVLCLSVTKWVHFAWGDAGIKRLFRRIYECLKPDGVLVLEPQPMKSYKSAIRKGLGKKDLTGDRLLKPHQFEGYLSKCVGFRSMKMLRHVRERGHAFNRPIMAFGKLQIAFEEALLPYHQFLHVGEVLPHIAPDIAPPAHPPLPNVVPVNEPNIPNAVLVNEAPPNVLPVNAVPENAIPENAAPEHAAQANAAPTSATPAAAAAAAAPTANAGEDDGQNEAAENEEGHEGRQGEGSMAVEQEESIQVSPQQASPEDSASNSNGTNQRQDKPAIQAESSAASGEEAVRHTSGYKRARPDEGAGESDERRSKIPRQDTDDTDEESQ